MQHIKDTVTVKLRKKKLDSLSITGTTGIIHFRDTFFHTHQQPCYRHRYYKNSNYEQGFASGRL